MTYYNPDIEHVYREGRHNIIWCGTKHLSRQDNLYNQQGTSTHWWPIAFYNSGMHLYQFSGAPEYVIVTHQRAFRPLSFRRYCQGGNCNGVHFRHLGHLHGIGGGPALIEVEIEGLKTLLQIKQRNFAWIYEGPQKVYALERRLPVHLPYVPAM